MFYLQIVLNSTIIVFRILSATENIHSDTVVFEATHGKFLLMCGTKQQHFTTGATTTNPSGAPEFTPRF